jgi:hypothetical protein
LYLEKEIMPLKDLYPPAEDKRAQDTPGELTYVFPAPGEEPGSESFPWLRCESNYDDSTEDQLCRVCRRINFGYLFSHASPHDLLIGSYGDVKQRDCAFCRLAVDEPRFS